MIDTPAKSKSQLKAERRAVQEAQRAAKAYKGSVARVITTKHEGGQKSQNVEKVPNERSSNINVVPPGETGESTKSLTVKDAKAKAKAVEPTKKLKSPDHVNSYMEVEMLPTDLSARPQESHRVQLFKHLPQADRRVNPIYNLSLGRHAIIHPSFLALGVDYDERRISGSNERCLSFLAACSTLLQAHQSNCDLESRSGEGCFFARSFGPVFETHVKFLDLCRPLPVTVRNAVQVLKQTISQLDSLGDWEECRTRLLRCVKDFQRESIELAGIEIAARATSSIRNGECICTFGYSSLVARVLERAWCGSGSLSEANSQCKSSGDTDCSEVGSTSRRIFSVMVVDSSPRFEGRRMLAQLRQLGIPCEYTHIGAFPSVATKVSLVMVGAHSLLSNGHVLARVGTAQLANVARAVSRSPVLVCAETYKFWEQAQSDAFEFNDLCDPDDLWRGPRGTSHDWRVGVPGCRPALSTDTKNGDTLLLNAWRDSPNLRLLHLGYDVLPPDLVTAVVTEKGTLPTTSVPVVLRVKQAAVGVMQP